MMDKKENKMKVSKKQCVETGIVFMAIFVFLGLRTNKVEYHYLTLGLALISILVPVLIYPLAFLWFGFAKLLGTVTSRILLTLIFFLIVTPVALFRKLIGKDNLQLRGFKKGQSSVFVVRVHTYTASDMEHQY